MANALSNTFSSSINTGLQQTPDLTDIQSVGKLAFQFISLYNAINVLAQAIDAYTGNVPQGQANSGQTPEQTVLVGNTANMWATAGAGLAAGFLVTLSNSGGATIATYANAATKSMAYGITMGAAAAGQQVQLLLLGLFNFGGSVTPGQLYYLSDSTPGGLSLSPPTPNQGHISQAIGFGVDTNSIFFNPCLNAPVT